MRKTFQKWLFLFVVVAFSITFLISFYLQTKQATINAFNTIELRLEDARRQIGDSKESLKSIRNMTDNSALVSVRAFAYMIKENPKILKDKKELLRIRDLLGVDQLNVSDSRGILIASTVDQYLGFDMASQKQSAVFIEAISNKKFTFVQDPMPRGIDSELYQYAGVARIDMPGIVQIGYKPTRLADAMRVADITKLSMGFRIGDNGQIIVCDHDLNVISADKSVLVDSLTRKVAIPQDDILSGKGVFVSSGSQKFICLSKNAGDFYIVGFLPYEEMYVNRNAMIKFLIVCNLILFGIVFVLVSELVQKIVINGIHKVNSSLQKITDGNLNEKITIDNNDEFKMLSKGINLTVDALKKHIDAAAARIDAELEFARIIQLSALPNIFPPYPHLHEFDIHAGIFTAKEVGGDFYDFYLVSENKVAVVVADVSGKGIGAALFMMTTKTLIKNLIVSGLPPSEALTQANRELCAGNNADMFVTVFLGILDFHNGKFTYANAGHNAPLLYEKKSHRYEYLNNRPNLVLAGMDNIRYKEHELQLSAGDRLFLYTDGVTEAQNRTAEQFSPARLQAILNDPAVRELPIDQLTSMIKKEVDRFADDVEQFDDITIMTLEYKGEDHGHCDLIIPAVMENLDRLTEFISKKLESVECSPKIEMQLNVAAEEIFTNIVHYAYRPGRGPATIKCEVLNDPVQVVLQFIDGGIPYNPLEKADPDISASADDREIGGLGIFMVKKTMDSIDYEYKDGKNILTIQKIIS